MGAVSAPWALTHAPVRDVRDSMPDLHFHSVSRAGVPEATADVRVRNELCGDRPEVKRMLAGLPRAGSAAEAHSGVALDPPTVWP